MGFFSSVGKGLLGAAVGFATGGPPGAVAGVLSGLASSGGDKATGSQSQSSTGTSQMQLRDLTPEEQALQDQGLASAAANVGMTPAEANALRDEEYARLFGSASSAINRSANLAQDKGYASDARRGLAGASASGARTDARQGDREFALSQASSTAEGQAKQAALMEQENRRAATASAMAKLNAVWQNRQIGSKITTTGSGTGNQTSTGPDTFGSSVAAGLGSALTNKDSYLNGLLGGKKSTTAVPT